MEPRFGRLYAGAVLRPLAEQVVGLVGAQPGETACDLICDGATLGVALGAAVGNMGTVVLVDTDPGLLHVAEQDVGETGCAVSTRLAIGVATSLAESSCDRVASLCTLGFWEGDVIYDVAKRVTGPTGCAAIVTWDAARPPLHEVALIDGLRDVIGLEFEVPGPVPCKHRTGACGRLGSADPARCGPLRRYRRLLGGDGHDPTGGGGARRAPRRCAHCGAHCMPARPGTMHRS